METSKEVSNSPDTQQSTTVYAANEPGKQVPETPRQAGRSIELKGKKCSYNLIIIKSLI